MNSERLVIVIQLKHSLNPIKETLEKFLEANQNIDFFHLITVPADKSYTLGPVEKVEPNDLKLCSIQVEEIK